MSDDEQKQTNRKSVGNYNDSRFDDAAHSIFHKYQTMGLVKVSDGHVNGITSSSSARVENDRRQTVVSSRACTIL